MQHQKLHIQGHVSHKELGLNTDAVDSFPVTSLIWAADISMCVSPLRRILILPGLLHQLCLLSYSLGPLGLSMWVCLPFAFFGMLRQSNLAPRTPAQFDASRYTCQGDVILAPPGLLIVVHWTKKVHWLSINSADPGRAGSSSRSSGHLSSFVVIFSLIQPQSSTPH